MNRFPTLFSHFDKAQHAWLLVSMATVVFFAATTAKAQTLQGTQFTYQGLLQIDGQSVNDTADFEFTLWDADAAGNMIGSLVAINNVLVEDGRITVQLDFGVLEFHGDARWLEIAVRSPAGGGGFTTLSPRQPLTATPVALALRGLHTEASENANFPGSWHVIGGHIENSVDMGIAGATIAGGGQTGEPNRVSDSFGTVGGGTNNTASGFASTIGGGDSNTTVDNRSTVGGGGSNFADKDCTVGGGFGNTTVGVFSTVAGGDSNIAIGGSTTIGGGFLNTASGFIASTVSGGSVNTASGDYSTVGGGNSNTASGEESTVAGGDSNIASGDYSTVGGGNSNTASGNRSIVPGGLSCVAGGNDSLAAGRRAIVRDPDASGDGNGDEGTFIWADNTNADFISTGPDQFLIRANGGVGIGTNSPTADLSVNGSANKPGGGLWSVFSDRRLKKNVADLHGSLNKLLQLRGVTFEFIDPESINEFQGQRIGMIAQEVELVFPDWIEQRRDGFKTMTVRGFEALAVEALRELRAEKDEQIARQSDQIASQNDQIERQHEQIERQEIQIAKLKQANAKQDSQVSELRDRLAQLERMVSQLAGDQ